MPEATQTRPSELGTGVVSAVSERTPNTSEKTGPFFSDKGKVEVSSTLLRANSEQEYFEVEIPVEDILKHSIEVPVTDRPLAASGRNSESIDKTEASFPAFEHKFERTEHSGRGEKVSTDHVRGQQADIAVSAFQGTEGKGEGASAEENSQSAPQETQAVKAENMMSGVSFEKLVASPVKETPAAPIRTEPLAVEVREKVQTGIKVSLEQGGGEVKMKLNPESLGEVRIKLNVASGVVRAEITVESHEVKRLIETDTSFLRDSLGAHGLTLDKCVVEVGRSSDARGREEYESASTGDEQRLMRDREHEKGNNAWQRQFRKNHARRVDGGVDFFI